MILTVGSNRALLRTSAAVAIATYAEYQAAIAALTATTAAWGSGPGGTGDTTYRTTAAADTGSMSGSSWISVFIGTVAKVVQHGLPSQAEYNAQIAAGRELLLRQVAVTSAPTPALDRNGYLSTTGVSSPRSLQFLAFWTPAGPMKMNPYLGLGPVPWDMQTTVY